MTVDRLGPYVLGPNDTPENGIYTGDARELAKAIPDESVDLIFTDPVYQNIDDYHWLAETAARVLKQNASCLTFCGLGYVPETHKALLEGGLFYRWTLTGNYAGRKQFHGRLQVSMTMCLWYQKGKAKMYNAVGDSTTLPPVRFSRYVQSNGASWDKHPKIVRRYIAGFSPDGSIVFDPFTGGGTVPAVCKMLGRRYLAFEIDPDVAEMARERVRMTQMPLFVLEPEQMTLGGD